MASGSWTFGTGNSCIQGKVNWSSSSNGSSANSSNISVAVYFRRTNSGYTSYGKVNTHCVINGGSRKDENGFSVSMSNPSKWTLVYAKNWTVGHNSDGSKQINIRVWGNGNFSIGSYDTNKTVTLDKILRYTSIKTWSVAEVGKTYAKMNWATADTVDWLCTYLNDSKAWTNITAEGGLNASSGSFVYVGMDSSGGTSIPSVSTLKPNTKYKIKLWVRRKDSKLGTYSSNIEFTTKSVASISNLNEGFSYNIGDDLNLTFENSSENKSWLAFYIKDESDNWEEILKTDEVIQANSYTWQLSNYASIFYSKLPNDNSKKCKIECGTTITENKQTISCISSKFVGTINVKNSNPVFTDFNYGDEDTSTQAVLGNKTYMIKNYGSMKVRIPVAKKAVAKNGASIIKYIISVDGVAIDSYEKKYSDSSEILCELGKYNTDGIGTISIYAIDSRGNVSDTVKKSFTVLPYSLPRFSVINLKRLNDYESEIVLDFQGVISKLSVNNVEKNTIKTVGYRYAEEGSSYPTNFSVINGVTISSTSSEYILSFVQNTSDDTFGITGSGSSKLVLDNNKSYNFQFYIRDSFSNEDHYELNIEQGIPIMFIGDNNQVSVGMIPDITRDEKFQVASDILATDTEGNLVGILDLISKMIIPSDTEPESQPNGGFWLKTSTIGEENIVG